MAMGSVRFIELFAGIGGFRLGLEKAGKFECVYANEFDKYAAQIYEKNFGEKPDTRDIREVSSEEIPDHELLTAGFPCQSFSVAGKRGGFADTRGTLFFEIARILRDKRPNYFLLENVKGLLSHESGKTFQTIIGVLTDIGYDLQWEVLNSKGFGVPQNRERVFIIGHLRTLPRPKVFPIGRTNQKALEYITGGGINKWLKGGKNQSRNNSQGQRVYATSGVATTQSAQGGGWGAKTGLYTIGMSRKHSRMRDGDFCTLDANYYKGLANQERPAVAVAWSKSHRTGKSESDRKRKNYGEIEERLKIGEFNTINTGEGGKSQSTQNFVSCAVGIRRLTPTECARLQGFPDDWHGGVSDARAYKAYGNAVTVNVVEEIGKVLLGEINGKNT